MITLIVKIFCNFERNLYDMKIKKMIKLINNERKSTKLVSSKACSSTDLCPRLDFAMCTVNSYDHCIKADYAGCTNNSYDYCGWDYDACHSGNNDIDL